MRDMRFLRDMVESSGRQAVKKNAAEEIMRLAQDPLLLYEHLQSCERGKPLAVMASPHGGLESCLQGIAGSGFDYKPAEVIKAAAGSYGCGERLHASSLHPEAFTASIADRQMAIEPENPSRDGESVTPPNLLGAILAVFGIVLVAACIFDFLALG